MILRSQTQPRLFPRSKPERIFAFVHEHSNARFNRWPAVSAHLVRNLRPPIEIIATSGQLRLRDYELPEGRRFLPKPYALVEVTGTLREPVGE